MGAIRLAGPVRREDQQEIIKSLFWVDGELETLAFDAQDPQVLRYTHRRSPPLDELERQLRDMAERLRTALERMPATVTWESATPAPAVQQDTYAALCARGWVRPVTSGAHVYAGVMQQLLSGLDVSFRRAAAEMGVAEYSFPGLTDLATLGRAGYLDGFPHQANFLCHLPEHLAAVEAFKAARRATNSTAPEPWSLETPTAAMCPTVCYHFYEYWRGQRLAEACTGATALSPCYRHEGRPTRGLLRLREFRMREIIFVGGQADVVAARDRLLHLMARMLEQSHLHARLQSATDPFFVDDYDKRAYFQRCFDLKHEAQAYLPDEDMWLAVGSVNYHQEHFGQSFDITVPAGERAHSCCLGFGLDRWCLAVFAQHGVEPERWPAALRTILDQGRLA